MIIVGSRGSKLALAQTQYVIDKLKSVKPDEDFKIKIIKTKGDLNQTIPLDLMNSKGLFVNEIEEALLSGDIQLAVHSMKDMPDTIPDGLVFADAWQRENPLDALILKKGSSLNDLPLGATIATGSKRRSFQLLKIRPDLNIVLIRGNIDTRLKKLYGTEMNENELDGIILAVAGLKRLGLDDSVSYIFTPHEMIPAPCQGRLAIELREDNHDLLDLINSFSDKESRDITFLERCFLKEIGGDCHLPIGAYAQKETNGYSLTSLFGSEDGKKLVKTTVHGSTASKEMVDRAVSDIKKQLEE